MNIDLLAIAAALVATGAAASQGQLPAPDGHSGLLATLLITVIPVLGCTAFLVSSESEVFAANNEDSQNPDTKVWFVPGDAEGRLGRVFLGYGNLWPQGGVNEKGLFFDGFGTLPLDPREPNGKPRATHLHVLEAMERLATVEEVIELFEQHDRIFMDSFMLMFADATGDAVRGGTQNSDSVLSWTPTRTERTRSHGYPT